jgi:glycosyltransferase involved in cell wall biosynthesis
MSLVSIGLPVYNGEELLPATLDSLLAQTYEEIEVIVCDNASTDRTPEIVREFAARDPRVIFHTSETNKGASWNYNRAFHLAQGEFFKWAAHDDLCAPELVEACLAGLIADPDLVLSYSRTDEIDPDGTFLRSLRCPTGTGRRRPRDRFESVVLERHASIPIFGVMRSEVLGKTPLMGAYVGSDWVLLCQLSLLGRFHEVPEVLFWRTEHPGTSQNVFEMADRLEWFDTSKSGRIGFPNWRMPIELARAVHGTDLPVSEKDACYRIVGSYVYQRAGSLRRDLFEASKRYLRRTTVGARIVDGMKRIYYSRRKLRAGQGPA